MFPFIVYTAGRSRTAWLARFLSYRDCQCAFEAIGIARNLREALTLFGPGWGSAETAAAPLWKTLDARLANLKRVVVKRPPDEIADSLITAVGDRATINRAALLRGIKRLTSFLDEISAAPGTLTVDYHELHKQETCAAIFEHCLPYPFDADWWTELKDRNVRVDVVEFLERHRVNRDLLAAA